MNRKLGRIIKNILDDTESVRKELNVMPIDVVSLGDCISELEIHYQELLKEV